MKIIKLLLISIVVVGLPGVFSASATGSDLNDLKEKFQGIPGIDNLPIGNGSLPNLEEAQNVLKKKCEQNGGPDAYAKVEAATEELKTCLGSLVNVTVVQEEVEEAKKTGSLDIVFGKYCAKIPEFDGCVHKYTDVMEICLDAKQKDGKKVMLNVTKSLSEFVCHKSGDRIAMFIAEGGVECLTSKQEEIQQCANSTMGQAINNTNKTLANAGGAAGLADFNLENFSVLTFDQRECGDIKRLQDCIVKELNTCKDPTPSNIVESLFKFIIKMTPCQNLLKNSAANPSVQTKSAGVSNLLSGASLSAAVILASMHLI